jgi:hypothetical protein
MEQMPSNDRRASRITTRLALDSTALPLRRFGTPRPRRVARVDEMMWRSRRRQRAQGILRAARVFALSIVRNLPRAPRVVIV